MCSRNLKSICGLRKKRKQIPVVKERDPRFEFVSASIQKPSHRMKRNLVGESFMYVLKNVGKSFQTNNCWVKLVSCITRSRM